VNPPAIERAGPETPHLQWGALDLYPNRRHHSKPDPRLDPTRPEQKSATSKVSSVDKSLKVGGRHRVAVIVATVLERVRRPARLASDKGS
jgi:hypothetical protein